MAKKIIDCTKWKEISGYHVEWRCPRCGGLEFQEVATKKPVVWCYGCDIQYKLNLN